MHYSTGVTAGRRIISPKEDELYFYHNGLNLFSDVDAKGHVRIPERVVWVEDGKGDLVCVLTGAEKLGEGRN